MADFAAIFGARGPAGALRSRASGRGPPSSRWPRASRRRCSAREAAAGGGRHRHRQDLCLSGAGAALGAAGPDLHRHPHAAGSALSPRPAAAGGGPGPARTRGAAQGPLQLSLPRPPGSTSDGRAELLPASSRPAAGGAVARLGDCSTRSGDLAELPELADAAPAAAAAQLHARELPGTRCAEFARCHVFEARRAALEADIVVVNHHLLLADLALKEDGFGDLLPSVDAVILDEAHQLPDLASEFFGISVSSRQIEAAARGSAHASCAAPGSPGRLRASRASSSAPSSARATSSRSGAGPARAQRRALA